MSAVVPGIARVHAAEPVPYVFGAQRTLVVLVNFEDKPETPWTVDEARELVFGQVDGWYREVSGGKTWLEGDVAGWLTVPLSGYTCTQASLADAADQAAAEQGFDLGAYDRFIYAFPSNGCGWSGVAEGGPRVPTRTWVRVLDLRNVVHELGHNLGLSHARGLDCTGGVFSEPCETRSYGDKFDVMGNSPRSPFNAMNQERLGYLAAGTSAMPEITASGTYELQAYAGTSGPFALKVPAGDDPANGKRRWLYLTHHASVGLEDWMSADPYLDEVNVEGGVVVNLALEGDEFSSLLLDMTPDSAAGQADLNDPALIVGATFADPVSGVRVTTLEAAGGRARVAVDLPLPTPGVNHAPEAVDDSGSTAKGTAVEIAVLANDVDADGDSLSVTEAAQPAHGSVRVLPDGRLQYQPQRRFTGTETFAYTVTDGVDSATAIVTVTVSGDDPGGGNGNAKGGGKGKNP